jgi:serine phosphatase RsbU (regulator of sigma subunit)
VGSPGARGYAGRPLVDADGIAVGTFCIVDTAPRSFTDDQLELLAELADWVRQEVIDSQESAAAATVQQRLLPSRLPALQGWDLAACCVPSRNIGGDFFDWQMVDGAATLVVADVMGKGTAAALLSATVRASLRAALRATAAHRSSDATALLTDALAEGAAAVQRDLTETGTLVTAFVAHLDTNGETLTWIDAGHGLAVLCHADGTHDWLRSGDMPLGVLADSTWRAAQTALRPGDRAVIVSDGLLDLLGGTAEALQALPVWAASARSADDLIADAKRLCAERIATDDVTVVIATPQ